MNRDELRDWMERQRISSRDLARHLGVHHMTVYKWRNGTHAVPPHLGLALPAIAKIEQSRRAEAKRRDTPEPQKGT